MTRLLVWIYALLLVLPLQAGLLSGTYAVGPAGDYSSLGAALSAMQTNGLSGPVVLELQAGYVSSVETFPLVFISLGTTATNTLTLRPQAGATALSISSADTTAATVDLNGAQFVTIDGRPGGVGTAKQLTIANTSTSGVALRFINEASGNTVQYTTLQGVNTSATSGTVVFSTTTGANGNDNNTLDHCDLGDGASTPTNGLYALGSTASAAKNNSGNTLSNCNFFNFYAATAVNAAGLRLDGGNTGWTISGNSFYQTTTRAAVAANVQAIYINSSSGDTFLVSGNVIGGSAPNAGGTAWTTTGTTAAYQFQGIRLFVSGTTSSSVQGNTIQNFVWTSSSPLGNPGVWSGIYVDAGAVNVGTVTGNTIGSGTGTGSVSTTTSGANGITYGIACAYAAAVSICNNSIGSITANGGDPTNGVTLYGIYALQGTPVIRNNIVGSTTTPNSLNAASGKYYQNLAGILCSTTGATIADNTVANLNNNDINGGSTVGITTYSATNTISGNVVRNLASISGSNSSVMLQSVCGILLRNAVGVQAVSQNVVYSLANSSSSAPVIVTGIYCDGGASGSMISRNLVHSLGVPSANTFSQVNGMWLVAGAFTAQNNMVRLGLDSNGIVTAGASIVRGIYDNGATAGRNFFHNTVYVGGAQTSGSNGTFAFDGTTGVGNARTYQNNIFVNARSTSGGTGKNYSVRYGGTASNPAGLTAGGNIFLASGTGGMVGQFNGTDAPTIAAWRAAAGQDVSSAVVDPLFINPTGNAATFDLRLQASNPAEGGGTPLTDSLTQAPASVADDFDGQTRSTLTPADIGADAGNFTSSSGDIYAPAIRNPLLISGSTANRVLTGWATITDNSGSVSGGANAPRLYFKKSTDADVFGAANDASGNGWKYVTATNSSSPYSFVLDYSLVNGGGVTAGDTVQYFVVAQDAANNLGSGAAAASASANPPVQNISAKPGAGVNSFSIVPGIGGTKTVGSGGDYATLSGAGGVFAAINGGVLTGNLVINLTSDVTEDGTVSLNPWLEEGIGGYTLTFRPDSATMRTISGNVNAGLITLNGADRVIIDGSFSGSGRYLTFRNLSTGTSACTIRFVNDASSSTLSNCVVEGSSKSTSLGVISFSTGAVTGNDNNLITSCQVRDLSTAAGVPNRLIASSGSSSMSNSGNTLASNELFNFNQQGISIGATGNGSWTISGNNIYEVNAATSSATGIAIAGGSTHQVTGNFIHDLLTTATQSTGISCSGLSFTKIKSNRITALNVNPATTSVYGINANANSISSFMLYVVDNQITLAPPAGMSTSLHGFFSSGSSTFTSYIYAYYNSIVLGGSESGTRSSWASLNQSTATQYVQNNLFLNFRIGGTSGNYAFGLQAVQSPHTISNNVYSGTGANSSEFMYYGGGMTFANWQIFMVDSNSQAGVAGTGNFTTAMFVDATNGDLHLVPGGNALVSAKGIPVSGYTDDYDGDLRPSGTPNIGSDQQPFADISVSSWTTLADGGTAGFGGVTVGVGSYLQTFTVTNSGNVDLTGLTLSLDGANAADFTVSALSAANLPAGGSSVTFSVTLAPHALGASNAALHLSSNESGARIPFDINLSGAGIITVGTWRQQYFGDTANTGNGADTFDYDHDGLPNLVEWACNLNPTAPSSLPATAVLNGTTIEFTYARNLSALYAGTSFTVEWSDTLANDWQTTGVSQTVLSFDGTVQQVKATLPAGSSGHRFVHLKVTAPP